MKHTNPKKTLMVLMAFFSSLCVWSGVKGDSLTHYLETAAISNPTVLQRLNEYQAALQKVPQAGSLADPELNLGVFLTPMELMGGNQVADIQLMQMFPWFGVLRNARDEMSLMAKARYETFRDARLQVDYDLRKTWYELCRLHQEMQISQKNIDLLRTIEKLALVKFRVGATGGNPVTPSRVIPDNPAGTTSGTSSGMQGMGDSSSGTSQGQASTSMQGSSMSSGSGNTGLSDLYRLQIEIGNLENDLALQKSRRETLVARFNSYLDRPADTPLTVPSELDPDSLEVSLTARPDSILSNNPMLGMLNFEKKSLEARQRMVVRMGYPMLGVGVDYALISKNPMSTSSMNGKDMVMPMLRLSLPVYRKKYKAMEKEANLLKTASVQNYKATANSLNTAFYELRQAYEDAGRRMKLYESQSLLARKSQDILIRSFSVSGTGLTDVLQASQQLLDFESKRVEAVADYNTAIAGLRKLLANSQIH